jgi:hypothetical protein
MRRPWPTGAVVPENKQITTQMKCFLASRVTKRHERFLVIKFLPFYETEAQSAQHKL